MHKKWEGNGMYSGSVKQTPLVEHLLHSSMKNQVPCGASNSKQPLRVIGVALVKHLKLCCKKINNKTPVPANHKNRLFLPMWCIQFKTSIRVIGLGLVNNLKLCCKKADNRTLTLQRTRIVCSCPCGAPNSKQ